MLLATGCERENSAAAWLQNEHERTRVSTELELKQFRYIQSGSSDISMLQRLKETTTTNSVRMSELRTM